MWDPLEYGGVTELYVPSEHIWLPDIVLYNKLVYVHMCVDGRKQSLCGLKLHVFIIMNISLNITPWMFEWVIR